MSEPTTAYMTVEQHIETGMFHGTVYRNHPTPSGCDRWLLSLSTNEGFDTERLAGEFMNAQFPELPSLDLAKLNATNELAGIPAIPKYAVITVMSYNPESIDPAPRKELPVVEVSLGGKITDIKLNVEQVRLLKRRCLIEDDSMTDDPNLSCAYWHYFVPAPIVERLAA